MKKNLLTLLLSFGLTLATIAGLVFGAFHQNDLCEKIIEWFAKPIIKLAMKYDNPLPSIGALLLTVSLITIVHYAIIKVIKLTYREIEQ